MPKADIVVMGTSAGGVNTLRDLFVALPEHIKLPILIVQHFPEQAQSFLPQILSRVSIREFKHAKDGEELESGVVYICPPGQHMLVEDGRIALRRGPKENGNRPAIDPLFRSAAVCYGPRLAAVLLSGLLDDGTSGMAIVKRLGGVTIAQGPEEAIYGSMPSNAIEEGVVDHVAPIEGIAEILMQVASDSPEFESCTKSYKKDPVEMNTEELKVFESRGRISALTCPECHGALYELEEGNVLHYRCRVGHAYSSEKLLEQQGVDMEAAIWIALRTLEENCDLLEHMINRAELNHRNQSAKYLRISSTSITNK